MKPALRARAGDDDSASADGSHLRHTRLRSPTIQFGDMLTGAGRSKPRLETFGTGGQIAVW